MILGWLWDDFGMIVGAVRRAGFPKRRRRSLKGAAEPERGGCRGNGSPPTFAEGLWVGAAAPPT
jgi:hypothetical protein